MAMMRMRGKGALLVLRPACTRRLSMINKPVAITVVVASNITKRAILAGISTQRTTRSVHKTPRR
jgi:hypothetical protein